MLHNLYWNNLLYFCVDIAHLSNDKECIIIKTLDSLILPIYSTNSFIVKCRSYENLLIFWYKTAISYPIIKYIHYISCDSQSQFYFDGTKCPQSIRISFYPSTKCRRSITPILYYILTKCPRFSNVTIDSKKCPLLTQHDCTVRHLWFVHCAYC